MPRDIGTGLYHYPDGTPGNSGQTIFSARYNTFINDLTNTLNQALPVNMGGTGGDNATTARDNLDAERAGAQVINYDTHVFEAGSFWSAVGATAAPNASNRFVGTCIINGDGTNDTFIQVWTPGVSALSYIRKKISGAWQAWMLMPGNSADLDAAYVNVTGDTMTGNLSISAAGAAITLNGTSTLNQNVIFGDKVNLHRWAILPGSSAAESGASAGSDFQILRYDNSGVFLGASFQISRETNSVYLPSPARLTGANAIDFVSPGAGFWYNTNGGVNRFFVGTEPTGDIFRIFTAASGQNALQVNGANATVQVANGIKYGSNNGVAFQWDVSGLNRIIDGTAAVLMWDNNSCSKSAISNGYQRLASGTILQWGTYTGGADGNVTFPIAFPANVLNIVATMIGNVGANTLLATNITAANPNFFNIQLRYSINGGAVAAASQNVFWMAVGV